MSSWILLPKWYASSLLEARALQAELFLPAKTQSTHFSASKVSVGLRNCASGPLVDTYAGSGSGGASGDGLPAKEATFNSLKGIAVNRARGELVIADDDVGRISTVHLSTGNHRLIIIIFAIV